METNHNRSAKKAMARRKPPVGSVFRVPLLDGGHALGQVIAYEPTMLNSVSCIFTSAREWWVGDEILEVSVIASLFTTHDLLTKGRWELLGDADIPITQDDFPYEHLRSAGWIGAKMRGSGSVENFVNAWFGLVPWDQWADAKYLEGFLFRGRTKPATATFKKIDSEQDVAGRK